MTRAGPLLVVAIAAAAVSADVAQDRQVFRAVGTLVTVEVAVRNGNALVRGLTAEDFVIEDNGIPQTIEMVDVESLPIDLTLVVDTSGSVIPMMEEIRTYVREAAAVLRVDDRVRLITFAGEVRDTFGLQAATDDLPVDRIEADGATALYDALIAGLMRTRREERRQLLVAFTDGIDTNSATTLDALRAVADRSDSVLHIFLVRDVMGMPGGGVSSRYDTRSYWLSRVELDTYALGSAARATGGWLEDVAVRPQLPARLRLTLEDFRTSYVLRYYPAGVTGQGWHQIAVRVPSGRYEVRARNGYVWGARGVGPQPTR